MEREYWFSLYPGEVLEIEERTEQGLQQKLWQISHAIRRAGSTWYHFFLSEDAIMVEWPKEHLYCAIEPEGYIEISKSYPPDETMHVRIESRQFSSVEQAIENLLTYLGLTNELCN